MIVATAAAPLSLATRVDLTDFQHKLEDHTPLVTAQEIKAHLLLLNAFYSIVHGIEGGILKVDPETRQPLPKTSTSQIFQAAVWRFGIWLNTMTKDDIEVDMKNKVPVRNSCGINEPVILIGVILLSLPMCS